MISPLYHTHVFYFYFISVLLAAKRCDVDDDDVVVVATDDDEIYNLLVDYDVVVVGFFHFPNICMYT